MRTLKELAQEVLAAQNACNLSGVMLSASEAICELRKVEGGPRGNDELHSHPITRLWASKIHDLAGMGLSNYDRFHEAHTACQQLAEG